MIFKVKTNDNGRLRLKGIIVLYGNRDEQKDRLRSERAAADMIAVRLVISLDEILGFNLENADTKGGSMQSRPIKRYGQTPIEKSQDTSR